MKAYRRVATWGFVLAFVLLVTGLLLRWFVANAVVQSNFVNDESHKAPLRTQVDEPVIGSPSLVFTNLKIAKSAAAAVNRAHAVAAYRFDSQVASTPLPNGRPAFRTGFGYTESFETSIIIRGTFTRVATIHGILPDWGVVEAEVPVTGVHSGDARRRLRPLLECEYAVEPPLYIAAAKLGSTTPLDASFYGPVTPADIEYFSRMSRALETQPYEDMPVETAHAWVRASDNPPKVWVGLARLGDFQMRCADDFHDALVRLPVEHTKAATFSMLTCNTADPRSAPLRAHTRQELPRLLIADDLAPATLKVVLETVLNQFKVNPHTIPQEVDVPALKRRAAVMHDVWASRPEYRDVLPLLAAVRDLKDPPASPTTPGR